MISIKSPCNNCKLRLHFPCTGPCKKWYEWYQNALEKLMDYEFAEEDVQFLKTSILLNSTHFSEKFTKKMEQLYMDMIGVVKVEDGPRRVNYLQLNATTKKNMITK